MFQYIQALRSRSVEMQCTRPIYMVLLNVFTYHSLLIPLGSTGLDGTTCLPSPSSQPQTEINAVSEMHRALSVHPGRAWLVATGALTNVALLFATFPDMVQKIKGLSIMGGAIGNGFTDAPMGHVRGEGERFGNYTRYAEFNIYVRGSGKPNSETKAD